jgi:hypothetical protein
LILANNAIQVKIDTTILKKLVNKIQGTFTQRVAAAWSLESQFFIGDIQENWYSGRKAGDKGLNVRSNLLRSSWNSDVMDTGNDVILKLNNPTPYGKVHEEGDSSKNIPKRTSVNEDFREKEMPKLQAIVRKVMGSYK